MLNKILFIDDDELMAEFSVMIIESGGFEVKHCSSGKKALSIVVEYSPDLILLDMQMPEMNGEQTLLELRKIEASRATPVIFLTGNASEDDVEKYLEIGAIGVISKPFDAKKLCQTIQQLWDSR